jgi:putative hydrolase of the HAD superfamily
MIPAPGAVRAIISDFGGVLTTPLSAVFAGFQEKVGIPPEALRDAITAITARDGAHPLFELECGRMTEVDFMRGLEEQMSDALGREVSMQAFTDHYWESLRHNDAMLAFLREARDAGYRLALLTNNVVEWEPRWRPNWPIDDLFEFVVDSGFVGIRKPDHRIYAMTLERLGLPAGVCVFIDDLEPNIVAAREVGMQPVHFVDTEQAIADVRAAMAG